LLKSSGLLSRLGEQAGEISLQCSETGGSLSRLKRQIDAEADRLSSLTENAASLDQSQAATHHAAHELEVTAATAHHVLERGNDVATCSLSRLDQLISRVSGLEEQLRALLGSIEVIEGVSKTIRSIAEETHMLGFNARIEAHHSGSTGEAFGAIADRMRQLSQDTANSALDIDRRLGSLDKSARELISAVAGNIAFGKETGREIDQLRISFTELAALVTQFRDRSEDIVSSVATSKADANALVTGIRDFQVVAATTSNHASEARERIDALEYLANDMFDQVEHGDVPTRNTPFVEMGLDGAREASDRIERALASGELSATDLFSDLYRPIAGTEPVQFDHPFAGFADRALRPMLDAQTDRHEAIVGCCLVDSTGYLPTHISERSQTQRSGERLWNEEFARNRQVFDDNHIRRALCTDGDFFVYTYRQELGGGKYRALRSVLVPLHFSGRKWGIYELGYQL